MLSVLPKKTNTGAVPWRPRRRCWAAAARAALVAAVLPALTLLAPAAAGAQEPEVPVRGVTVEPTELTVAEGATASYTAVLTTQPTGDVTVAAAVSGHRYVRLAPAAAAAAPAFVDAPRTTTLTFTPESWDRTQTVTLRSYPDVDVLDGSARVRHTVTGADYEAGGVTAADVTVAVTDDGVSVEYALVVPVAPVTESAGTVPISVTAVTNGAVAPQRDYAVVLTSERRYAPRELWDGFDAQSGIDYRPLSEVLRFARSGFAAAEVNGAQRYTQTVSFAAEIYDDQVAEGAETFPVSLTSTAVHYGVTSLGDDSTTVVTIVDDDALLVSVAAAAPTVPEGRDARFTVTVSGATSSADVAVDYAVSGTATAGADYTAPSGTLTIPAGAASGTITIETLADDTWDVDETLVVALNTVTTTGTATTGGPAATTIEDAGPEVSISSAVTQVTEGEEVVFTLTRTLDTTLPLRVNVLLGGHTKMVSAETLVRKWVELGVGERSTEVTLTTQDDAVNEGDGELFAKLRSHATYRLAGGARKAVLVKDDDIPVLTVGGEAEIIEGTALGWTFTRSDHTSTLLVVDFALTTTFNHPYFPLRDKGTESYRPIAEGEAARQYWYDASGQYVYVGPAGGTARVELLPDRCANQPDPCFLPRYTLGEPSSFTTRISNRFPTLLISADAPAVSEGDAAAFTLERVWNAENLAHETTVVAFGVTQDGDVIDGVPPTMVTFAPGETEQPLSIATREDEVSGGGGSVTVQLEGLDDATTGTIETAYVIYDQVTADGRHLSSATVTVLDDDADSLPTVTVAATAESVTEGQDVAFTLTRTGAVTDALEVTVEVTDPGAAASGSLPAAARFDATAAHTSVTIATRDDAERQPDRLVTAALHARDPSTYLLGSPASAEVTVVDNDARRELSLRQGLAADLPRGGTATPVRIYGDQLGERCERGAGEGERRRGGSSGVQHGSPAGGRGSPVRTHLHGHRGRRGRATDRERGPRHRRRDHVGFGFCHGDPVGASVAVHRRCRRE